VEILVELLGSVLLLVVAFAVGSVVFLLVRLARLTLRGLVPPPDVVDPHGRRWAVRIALAPEPLRLRLSRWLFRRRPKDRSAAGDAHDQGSAAVHKDEIVHPSGLVERFDEAAGLVVWVILAATLVAMVVLVLEVLLVVVLAALVFVVRTLSGHWQCEVVTPYGAHFHVPSGSLLQARDDRERLRDEIAAGLNPVPLGQRPASTDRLMDGPPGSAQN
jgi:hypothetical protein